MLDLLAHCAGNAGRGTSPALAATYYEKVVITAREVETAGDGYHIHWPQRGDWATTTAGATARANARACMIVDLRARVHIEVDKIVKPQGMACILYAYSMDQFYPDTDALYIIRLLNGSFLSGYGWALYVQVDDRY